MSVRLEPFSESDIETLIGWVDRPGASDLWASRTYPFPLTREIVQSHLERTKSTPCELVAFKILKNDHQKPVGHVELDRFDHQTHSVRITRLFIDPANRGSGIARQAIELLLNYCFENLKLNRVEILAIETNEIAFHLYRKLGFTVEGFLRENMFLSGQRFGSHLLSILRSEHLQKLSERDSSLSF